MAVEEEADRAVFFDTGDFAVAAVYRAGGGGPPVAVILLRDEPSAFATLGDTRLRSESATFQARVSVVPALARGDTLAIDADVFRVQGCEKDVSGALWTIDTAPASG